MTNQILPAVRMTLVLTVLTGLIYPGIVTGVVKVLFPHQAAGSLIEVNGKVVGSELIGQKFTQPFYFHGRPSGAGNGYDAANSGATNLGPTNPDLIKRVAADVAAFHKENPTFTGPIPADLLTMSASGLDPHVSPAAAYAQEQRVADARATPVARVHALIDAAVEPRTFGFLGEPRVNVLKLNLALDREIPVRK
jgi:K+-transporting ATPase ATPase C chain